jgi:hypothetical protein
MAKSTNKPPRRSFEDTSLALCVVEALVEQGLVATKLRIPELEPEDDDDLDDESESWRDRFDNNQDQVIDQLLALLEQHRDKLAQLREVQGALINIAMDYEPDVHSLAGIEACTNLERIGIWTSNSKLDLSPLKSLPALVSVDLGCAGKQKNLGPLLEIESLREVIGDVDARTAAKLRSRNVEVKRSAQ